MSGLCEQIHECANGAAYEEFLPDRVFRDIRMKNVDGLEATRRVVANLNDDRLRETVNEAATC